MLQQTINAYLFRQYADDENLQAFADAYNLATQELFIDWFNSVNLPIYTGLSGDLLAWVGLGLYGLPKTALESPRSAAIGAYNTTAYNTLAYNEDVTPQQTIYGISDDVYKRILTWHIYKGDGKRFCVRWLKRRIMRFILGTNGVDPQPYYGFSLGTENTTPVSVTVINEVMSIKLFTATFAALGAQLTSNILQIFAAALLGGALDVPARYQYTVQIE